MTSIVQRPEGRILSIHGLAYRIVIGLCHFLPEISFCRNGILCRPRMYDYGWLWKVLHGFPKYKTLILAWIAAVRRQKFLPTKFSRICSLHFSPSAFTMDPELAKQCGYKKMTVRPDAVPTEHLPSSSVNLKRTKSVERSGLAVAKRRNSEVNKTGAHQNVSLGAHPIFPIMHTRSPLHPVRLFTDLYTLYCMHASCMFTQRPY